MKYAEEEPTGVFSAPIKHWKPVIKIGHRASITCFLYIKQGHLRQNKAPFVLECFTSTQNQLHNLQVPVKNENAVLRVQKLRL